MKYLFVILFSFCLISLSWAGYSEKLCKDEEHFECYKVKHKDSWDSLFPDETQQALVKSINRLGEKLHSGMKLAIPHDLSSATLLEYSPLNREIDPPGERVVVVSIKDMAWGAYEPDGILIRWGPISSARGYCPDIHRGCNTPRGKFEFYQEGGPDCKSTKFPVGRGGAPMPYCMFFKGGFAMHGSYELPGYNASHGCIRMLVPDAEWLSKDFVDPGVTVIIH